MISVVVPTFNRAHFLAESLESIRHQTCAAWEAIIVDDGSTDETVDILKRYEATDARFRWYPRSRPPKGANTCRNIGIAEARGEYLLFLDSDDLLAQRCFERRIAAIEANPEFDFILFQGELFKNAPGDFSVVWNRANEEPHLNRFVRGDSVWPLTGPIWKTSAVRRLGGFDEELACWQDIDLHVRALLTDLRYLDELSAKPDFFIRRHNRSTVSQQGFKSRVAIGSILRLFEKTAETSATTHLFADESLRQMLAVAFGSALDNRQFDLANSCIDSGRRREVLSPGVVAIWKAAVAAYRINTKGLRGFARFGKCLIEPFKGKLLGGVIE